MTNSPIERPQMFRRRRFRAAHQKKGWFSSLLRPLGLALAIVGLPSATAVWALTSPRFAVEQFRIASGDRVPATWVEQSLAPLRGRHVLLLTLNEVENLLASHRWVEGVEVRKELPNVLSVEVVERVPAAVLDSASGRFFVDSRGREIDSFPSDAASTSMLVVEGDSPQPAAIARAVEAVAVLNASGSSVFGAVRHVKVIGGRDLSLAADSLPFRVLVKTDRLQPAIRQFEQLLPEILRRYEGLRSVDLRFRRQIVMQFPEA